MKKVYLSIIILIICVICVSVLALYMSLKPDEPVEPIYLETKYYNEGKYKEVSSGLINELKDENYVLFTYNSYCAFSVPCENIFEEYMKKYKIDFLSIPFEDFKNTYLYKKIKYGPSIIIVSKGKIVAYLDAESDEDLDRFQKVEAFESWMNKYIHNKKS